MPFRQGEFGGTRQGAEEMQRWRQAVAQHFGVSGAAHAIRQHTVKRQMVAVARQSRGQRAEGLRHGGAVDHREYWNSEALSQIRARRLAVV